MSRSRTGAAQFAICNSPSARNFFALTPEHRQPLLRRRGLDTHRLVMKLDRPPPAAGAVGGGPVLQETVEEEAAAGRQRYGDGPAASDGGVADLPVPSLEMDHRAGAVAARQDAH